MKLDQLKSALYKERQIVDAISTTVKQNMASLLAILAAIAIPAVPSIFAANGMYVLTANWTEEWRKWAAITIAIAVEGAGMSLSILTMKTYSAWRKQAASMNEVKAMIGAVLVYTVIAIALISFSDVPIALKFIVGSVPILGVAFYIGLGFETDLANRLDEIADEKSRKNAEKKAAKETKRAAVKPQDEGVVLRLSRQEWRNYAVQVLEDNPQVTGAELARKIGCSERTGQNILKEIKK